MLRAAFDLWNGQGRATLADVLGALDRERGELLCSLMLATCRGDAAVAEWTRARGQSG
jgi:hypothetical protein